MFGIGKKAQPAPIEFHRMEFEQLLELKEQLDKEVSGRRETAILKLKENAVRLATVFKVNTADLFGAIKQPRKKRAVRIKYRNPENPTETWSGLGKPKKWLQAHLDQGRTLEEFKVKD